MTAASECFVGINVGGTTITGEAIDISGKTLSTHAAPNAQGVSLRDQVIAAVRSLERQAEAPPSYVYVVAAGPVVDGVVRVTNAGNQVLDPVKLMDTVLCNVGVVNDMMGPAQALTRIQPHQYIEIRPPANEPRRAVIVSHSTGVGAAVIDLRTGVAMDTEGGHIVWQPASETEREFLAWLQDVRYNYGFAWSRTRISIEQVISGKHGFFNWVAYLTQDSPVDHWPEALQQCIRAVRVVPRMESIDIAETVTSLPSDDPLRRDVMFYIGAGLGQYMHSVTLAYLPDVIYLMGSVATRNIDEFVSSASPFMDGFRSVGSTQAELVERVGLRVLTTDLSASGAAELARRACLPIAR